MNEQASGFDFSQYSTDFLQNLEKGYQTWQKAGGGQEWLKHFRNNAFGTLPLMLEECIITKSQVEDLIQKFNNKVGTHETFESLMESAGGETEVS